jgi:hypothetical protein
MKRLRDTKLFGYLWFIHRFGVRRLWRYERFRRTGATINYAEVFSLDELAVLREHLEQVPWER